MRSHDLTHDVEAETEARVGVTARSAAPERFEDMRQELGWYRLTRVLVVDDHRDHAVILSYGHAYRIEPVLQGVPDQIGYHLYDPIDVPRTDEVP
jgi:hypothetical protein